MVVVSELLQDSEPDAENSPVEEFDVTVRVIGAVDAWDRRTDIAAEAVPAVIVCAEVPNERPGWVEHR